MKRENSLRRMIAVVLCAVIITVMLPLSALADLAAPSLYGASASGNGIKVSWESVSGATGYRIYRKNGGGGWKALTDVSGTSYVDTSAKDGVTYTYTVRCMSGGSIVSGYDSVGVSAAWSKSTAGYVSAPSLKSAKGESSGIRVTWGKVSGATGYRIYRKQGSGKWGTIANVGDVDSYLDTGAASGKEYTYTVRCLKGGSLASDYDRSGVKGSWKASSDLATPKLVSATAEGSGIRVTWEAVSGASAYRLYRKTGGSSWSRVTDVSGTSYLDNATSQKTTYSYTVRCLNSAGKVVSSYDKKGVSASWQNKPGGKLATPVLKGAKYSGNTVVVTWNGVTGATGYRVYRKNGSSSWKTVGDVTGTTFTDSSVSSGVRYTYTVRAMEGTSVASGYDTTGVSLSFYAVPQLVSAVDVDSGIQLTWKAVGGASRYLIYRKSGSGGFSRLVTTTSTSYTDTGIALGVNYTYTVRVISSDGKSLISDYDHTGISTAFVGKTAVSSLSSENGGVLVTWGSIPGAASYQLLRRFGDGGWTSVTVTPATSFTDYSVVNNTTYTYIVRALDSGLNYIGLYDATGKTITYYATPTLLSCVRVSTGLVTTWEAVEGVGQYEVFRKIGSGSWMSKGIVSTTSYTDTSVPSGTKCLYTVRCVSSSGAYLSSYDKTGIGETSYMDIPVLEDAYAEDGATVFSWNEVDKANYYKVYRKTGDRTAWIEQGTTASTYYVDTNVKNGETYYYTVATCDGAGNNLSEYNPTGISVTYYDMPILLIAENAANGIKVTWNAVDGIGTYRVYRKTGSGNWTALGTASGTSYTDTSVVSNANYWYTVSCMKNGAEVSVYDYSGVKSTYFEPPKMGSATNGNGYVYVTWSPVDGIGTYKLYRKIGNGSWIAQGDVSGTAYTDTGVSSGNKYSYTVRCVSGGSIVSDYNSTAAVTYLGVPSVTATSSTKGKIEVSWSAVSGAAEYRIFRKTAATNWVQVYNVSSTVKKITQSDLTSGTVYYYMVVAASNDGSLSANGSGTSCQAK